MLRRIAIALAAAVALAIGTFVILTSVFGMRLELAGSGTRPIVTFGGDEDDHYAALEADRASNPSTPADGPIPPATAVPDAPASAAPATSLPVAASAPATSPAPARPSTPDVVAWPDFRGPARDGRYRGTPIRTDWPADGLTPLWQQPIGGGYASFVVADGRAFTIEQRRDDEVVAAYDVASGREVWTHGWPARFEESMGGPGPRATPTWHDGRVYALGATGRFWCLDAATGDVVWERNILEDSGGRNLQWAMAASPLVVNDLVVVQPGGRAGWSVVAYRRDTGDVAWHVLDDVQSYTSPMLVTLAGQPQVLVVTAERVAGLAPADGRVLWDHPWRVSTVPNISQPLILGDDRVFLSAGYGHGAAVIEVTAAGSGYAATPIWRNNRMKNRLSSSVLHDGYVYGLDEGILACLDAATGDVQWKGGRYGHGQLLLAGDHLVVITERGELVLVAATPARHEEQAMFSAIDGKTWNVPAIAGGILLVRNAREMAAFDLRPAAAPAAH